MNEQSTFLTKATDMLSGLWKSELSAMESKRTHLSHEKYLVKWQKPENKVRLKLVITFFLLQNLNSRQKLVKHNNCLKNDRNASLQNMTYHTSNCFDCAASVYSFF